MLLIDADLRRPSVHHLLNVDNRVGLGDCLRQPEKIAAHYQTVSPTLSVLAAGRADSDPMAGLVSGAFKELAKSMKIELEFKSGGTMSMQASVMGMNQAKNGTWKVTNSSGNEKHRPDSNNCGSVIRLWTTSIIKSEYSVGIHDIKSGVSVQTGNSSGGKFSNVPNGGMTPAIVAVQKVTNKNATCFSQTPTVGFVIDD